MVAFSAEQGSVGWTLRAGPIAVCLRIGLVPFLKAAANAEPAARPNASRRRAQAA